MEQCAWNLKIECHRCQLYETNTIAVCAQHEWPSSWAVSQVFLSTIVQFYTVQWQLYAMCTMHNVWTEYNVRRTMYIVQCTSYNVRRTMCVVHVVYYTWYLSVTWLTVYIELRVADHAVPCRVLSKSCQNRADIVTAFKNCIRAIYYINVGFIR